MTGTKCWMVRGAMAAAAVLMLAPMTGCEWESTGEEGSWSGDENWVSFSGLYRDVRQGVLVKNASVAFDTSSIVVGNETLGYGIGVRTYFSDVLDHSSIVPGSVLISAGPIDFTDDGAGQLTVGAGYSLVTTELAGAGDGVLTTFSGVLANHPVAAGTVSVDAGGFYLVDNGSGLLSGGGKTGTINYQTGAWSIDLLLSPVVAGAPITITYQYEASGSLVGTIVYSTGAWSLNMLGFTLASGQRIWASYRYTQESSAAEVSGSSGTPVYTFSITQSGNRLTIIDSNGNRFEGQIYDIRTTSGDIQDYEDTVGGDEAPEGIVTASFVAEGTAFGQQVRLEGTFQGTMLVDYSYMLFDRMISGTWRESGGASGVFYGLAPVYTADNLEVVLTDGSGTAETGTTDQ